MAGLNGQVGSVYYAGLSTDPMHELTTRLLSSQYAGALPLLLRYRNPKARPFPSPDPNRRTRMRAPAASRALCRF